MQRASSVLLVPALAGALAVSVTSCARPHYMVSSLEAPASPTWSETHLTEHVLLVSIDGLRPDAIGAFSAPTLARLLQEGSYTLSATTILPSKTLPSHTSMLTGQPPERHGVLWNTPLTAGADLVELPTVFGVIRSRGYRTAAFFSKSKFQPLQRPGTLDYSQAPGGWFGKWSSTRTVRDAETYLARARPNLMFVHLSDPDVAGHRSGWMSASYGRAVLSSDAAIARLLAAADQAFGAGGYTVIVTADHGGHDFDHGSSDRRDVTIPWIAWGRGVQPGRLHQSVRTVDTASTILWLLGVDRPPDWAGEAVAGAFKARRSADGS